MKLDRKSIYIYKTPLLSLQTSFSLLDFTDVSRCVGVELQRILPHSSPLGLTPGSMGAEFGAGPL